MHNNAEKEVIVLILFVFSVYLFIFVSAQVELPISLTASSVEAPLEGSPSEEQQLPQPPALRGGEKSESAIHPLISDYPTIGILYDLADDELDVIKDNKVKLPFFEETLQNYKTLEKQSLIVEQRSRTQEQEFQPISKGEYSIKEFLSFLEEPEVLAIEPERVFALTTLPNYAYSLSVPAHWNMTSGEDVPVCLIDSGVNNITVNASISYYSSATDFDNHGTVNANILLTLAPNVTLYSAKAFERRQGNLSNILYALHWCENTSIILLPFGSSVNSRILNHTLIDLYDDGILLIGAAGNEGNTSISYPAGFETVVAVGSVNGDNETSDFSNTGNELELMAYGEDAGMHGTSFAVPQVGAIAALVKGFNNTITLNELRAHLRVTAFDIADTGRDDSTGYGIAQLNLTFTNATYDDFQSTYDCEETNCTASEEEGNYTLLSYLDGRTTMTLNYANGRLVCNNVMEWRSSRNNIDKSPNIYDCDDSDECDYDEEEKAYLRFDAGNDLSSLILHSATLSVGVEGDDYSQADGEARVYASGSYNPSTLTWNSRPSSNGLISYKDVDDDEYVTLTSTNLNTIQRGFSGRYAYFEVWGDADGDEEFEATVFCDDPSTELIITYQECTSGACCDETNHFRPAGYVCNPAHGFTCRSASSSGCSGIAYEDRCTGAGSACPDNNYEIFYPSACTGTLCAGSTCSGNQQTPARFCQGSTCEPASITSCNNYLTCGGNQCKTFCSRDSDCIAGYTCNREKSICIIQNGGNLRTLDYDAHGNLADDERHNFTYDSLQRLINVQKGNETVAEYAYDSEGRRVKKQEGNETTYYVGGSIIVVNGSGTYNFTYYWLDDKLVAGDEPRGMHWYHTDVLGSPVLITNNTGGAVERFAYTPYGYSEDSGRYQFTGYEKDDETSYLYAQARYYNARTGRFNQPDTLLPEIYDPQQLNRYSYARNNPYRYVDKSGQWIDVVLDIGFILWDVVDIIRDPSSENLKSLGLDVGSAFVPGVVGLGRLGKVAKGAKIAEKGADEANLFSKLFGNKKGMAFVPKSDDIIKISGKKLQSKFKHASDFGIIGNYNKENAKRFKDVIESFVTSSDTKTIEGTYRGTIKGTHYYNPETKQWVFKDTKGDFVSGWKLLPSQVEDLTKRRNVK